jgi:transcriptional regulator with XRE-family HTH domain
MAKRQAKKKAVLGRQWRAPRELASGGRSPVTGGRLCRRVPNLHLSRAAKKIGISAGHLSKVLAGKGVPSLQVAARIARVLDVSLEQVMRFQKQAKAKIRKAQERKRK